MKKNIPHKGNTRKKLLTIGGLLGVVVSMAFVWPDNPVAPPAFDANSGIAEVLIALGDEKPLHYTANSDAELVQRGLELITLGRSTGPDGQIGKRQSKYFVCTNCHNIEQEDPNIMVSDPDARLDYVAQKGIPFLQGTTLWGIVNRETWYNDDYLLKYGDLVKDSRDTLMNAIELCTIECSQGRRFVDWEMDAVMAYLYSIQIQLSDIKFNDDQYAELNELVASNDAAKKKDAVSWIKQQYMLKSPATFMYPQAVDQRKLGESGNPAKGKLIYDNGCQHCHASDGVTNYVLDESNLTFNMLENHLTKQTHYSVYEITRKGTYAVPGYRPYMPHYTEQRMSKQQLEDLVAYIKQEANK